MSIFIKLVQHTVEQYVRTQEVLPVPASLPQDLQRQRACYVSVFENPGHRLRSWYGEPLPRHPTLAEEIIMNTMAAVTSTPARQVHRAELPYLSYSVGLVGPLQRVSDAEHLDPAQYGLYVRADSGKTALLLPQRVGIETAQDQIGTALREATIDGRAELYTMYRFPVTFYDS